MIQVIPRGEKHNALILILLNEAVIAVSFPSFSPAVGISFYHVFIEKPS